MKENSPICARLAEMVSAVDEMLRTVAALQRTSDGSAMTPEGWQPGDDLLAPPELAADGVLAADKPTGWFYTLASDGKAR